MEYIIITLLVAIIICFLFFSTKKFNETTVVERLAKLEVNIIKELSSFKNNLSRDLNEDFNQLNEKIDYRLRVINEKVNERLDENFEKTNKTFVSVLERLAKIDEAQKKIDLLSNDIVALQGVLTDKKSRGIFGEVNLAHIMGNVFGNNNKRIYQLQHSFNNGVIADCLLFAPEPLGKIVIDSKFPLENYQTMVNKKNPDVVRLKAEKDFKNDMKKHIDDIASKYIIPGVTTDQAILFLPAEAIFAEVNAYHQDLIDHSYKKRVWITSPTTLISTLTTIQIIIKNLERDKYASIIHQELKYLDQEFRRYKDRWDRLSKSIDVVSKEVKDIHTTTSKITKRFTTISRAEIQGLEHEN